jgi:adenylate kinase
MRVNLVLIGPPGSGKGTQAIRLARRFRIPHISTGDILRQAVRDDSPLGREVGAIISRGQLVSDQLISDLVRDRLAQPDTRSGFILDGYPRTIVQAQFLYDLLAGAPLVVAQIDVPSEEIVRRISSRRICNSCRLTQSVSDLEAGHEEDCPYCGGRLVRRNDDEPETVRTRLNAYAAFAEPVIDFYKPRPGFLCVNGLRPPDEVTADLITEIELAGKR